MQLHLQKKTLGILSASTYIDYSENDKVLHCNHQK